MKQLLLLFCLVVGYQAIAQKPLSLEEAINYAMQNSTTIKNAHINIADADAQIMERRSIGMPKVNGEIGYTRYLQVPISILPEQFELLATDPTTGMVAPGFSREASFVLKNDFKMSLGANMLLYDGTYNTALKAARLYKDYVQAELNSSMYETKKSVIDVYLPSLLVNENVKLLEKNITNLNTTLFETKELYKEGFVEQLDVDRLELSLANLQTELEALAKQQEQLDTSLKFVIGMNLNEVIDVTDDIDALLEEATSEEMESDVDYSTRTEYNLAQVGLKLSELNIEQYEQGYWPSVAAFANYQYAYQGDDFKNGFWFPTFLIGVQANIPIFDGFEKKAKIQRAKLSMETSQNQTKALTDLIKMEVYQARTAYLTAKERVASQKKNIALAEKIYNTTQIKYKEGVGSSLELIQAEQSLYQTQGNYTNALFDLLKAKVDLNKALGK